MKRVIVSVFNNLFTDQRVEKVCKTLHDNGYKVELIGNTWGGAPEMSRPYPFTRISLKSKVLKFAYVEFNRKLYSELKNRADHNTILLANDLDTLLPNYIISKKMKIPLVFDSHEIFTEMPSVKGRWTQKIWKSLEKPLITKIQFMMTASESYAEWFQKEYGIKKPIVVQNFPKKIISIVSIPENQPKVILYQGMINPSRGIQKMILAMHYLDNAILKIAGDGPKREEYEQLVIKENLKDKVFFLGKLYPDDLRLLTQSVDVGLSIEENGGISYLYSLPNKVSDYIQARVPSVLINFPEMKRIKQQFDVGEMIEDHNPETIAKAINIVFKKGRNAYRQELNNAADVFCWENEETKILKLFREVEKHQ